jgi:hypothetical protein
MKSKGIHNGKLQKGDRVKLTSEMAMVMARGIAPRRQKLMFRPQWFTRVGTVHREHRYSGNYMVKWDDRMSLEAWPAKALVKIDADSN